MSPFHLWHKFSSHAIHHPDLCIVAWHKFQLTMLAFKVQIVSRRSPSHLMSEADARWANNLRGWVDLNLFKCYRSSPRRRAPHTSDDLETRQPFPFRDLSLSLGSSMKTLQFLRNVKQKSPRPNIRGTKGTCWESCKFHRRFDVKDRQEKCLRLERTFIHSPNSIESCLIELVATSPPP